MTESGKYLTINEAAQELGVDRRRIRALIREGTLETVENPLDRRATLVKREDIERLREFPRAPKKEVA